MQYLNASELIDGSNISTSNVNFEHLLQYSKQDVPIDITFPGILMLFILLL
jgi:hypothetical protein